MLQNQRHPGTFFDKSRDVMIFQTCGLVHINPLVIFHLESSTVPLSCIKIQHCGHLYHRIITPLVKRYDNNEQNVLVEIRKTLLLHELNHTSTHQAAQSEAAQQAIQSQLC